jgi:hypothetical protein
MKDAETDTFHDKRHTAHSLAVKSVFCIYFAVSPPCRFQAMKDARAAREAAQRQQNFYQRFPDDPFSSSSSSSSSSSRRGSRGGYIDSASQSGASSSDEETSSANPFDTLITAEDVAAVDSKFGGGKRGNTRQDWVRRVMGKRTPTQEQVCVVFGLVHSMLF